MNVTQQGGNVDFAGSGSFDLTGLDKSPGSGPGTAAVVVIPQTATLSGGLGPFDSTLYGGSFIGPSNFGPGISGFSFPSSGTGSPFQFNGPSGGVADLIVPFGYVSGTVLSDTSVYSGQTAASLGMTPGTYTWTWDGGADSLVLNVLPEPEAVGVLGAGMVGVLGRRRRAA